MPEERISSEPPCFKMGALALNNDDVGADIYRRLGLKELRKGVLGTPRFLTLLSSILENSVQKNEKLLEKAQTKDALTVFHGARAPPVGLQQYIDRIFKYAGCSPSCFIVAYIYVDRYLQQTDSILTSFNVHRLLASSVMVAAKFIDDAFFNNAYYAKVGGVSTSEMNRKKPEDVKWDGLSRPVGFTRVGQETTILHVILPSQDDPLPLGVLYHCTIRKL